MNRPVEAGRLRHRLTIQRATEVKNSSGEIIQTWATIATRWGAVEPLTGREQWLAQQANAIATHRVTIRYYSGLTEKDRFLYGTRVLNIDTIDVPDEIQEHMECMVVEGNEPVTVEITQGVTGFDLES